MNIVFMILCALFTAVSSLCKPLQANVAPIEQGFDSTIVSIDKNSPSRNAVIRDLLALQKSLIISIQEPIPEDRAKTGFLLVPMTMEYISDLLEHKHGCIVCAYKDQILVGYALLTDPSNFKELYQDEHIGRFETSIDEAFLNVWLGEKGVGYIEQIAVKPGYSRMGIGSRLMSESKKLKAEGLIADVFIYPVKNESSLSFFSHQGFMPSGILYQYPTANANFRHEHRTQVFFWNP